MGLKRASFRRGPPFFVVVVVRLTARGGACRCYRRGLRQIGLGETAGSPCKTMLETFPKHSAKCWIYLAFLASLGSAKAFNGLLALKLTFVSNKCPISLSRRG